MKSRVFIFLVLACVLGFAAIVNAAAVKEITVMLGIPAAQPQILEEVVAKFEKAHPGIKVSLLNGADAKVLASIAAGVIPDVATINANQAPAFYKGGSAVDLTPFIQADKFDLSLMPPNYESLTYQGRWYGLPQAGGAFADLAIFYNRDLFDAAGLQWPTHEWTWDTFKNAVQKLSIDKQNDGVFDQVGYGFNNTVWPTFVWSGGGDIFNETHTELTLTKPAALSALEFWADMTRKGHITIPIGNFAGGLSAMRAGAYFETRTVADKGLTFDWSVVELPRGPAGAINRRSTHPWVIPTGAKYPREGWEFIKFWLSDEIQADLVLKWNWRPPQTATIARQLARTKFDKAPYTYSPFMGTNTVSKPLPVDVKNWDQISATLDKALAPVWKGEQSVLAAMTAVEPQVKALMK